MCGVLYILCLSKTNSLIILFIALDNLFGYINENRVVILVCLNILAIVMLVL